MKKYIKNIIIAVVIFCAALVLGNATSKNNEPIQSHDYDPCIVSNITHNIEVVQSDIDHLSDDILKCHVNIKFANRCRHGYCYDDIENLEKDLNQYKRRLRERKHELYCLSKLLTKESEKSDNGIL